MPNDEWTFDDSIMPFHDVDQESLTAAFSGGDGATYEKGLSYANDVGVQDDQVALAITPVSINMTSGDTAEIPVDFQIGASETFADDDLRNAISEEMGPLENSAIQTQTPLEEIDVAPIPEAMPSVLAPSEIPMSNVDAMAPEISEITTETIREMVPEDVPDLIPNNILEIADVPEEFSTMNDERPTIDALSTTPTIETLENTPSIPPDQISIAQNIGAGLIESPAIRPVSPETSGMGPETVRDIAKDMIGEKIEDEIPPLMADSTISQNDGRVVLEPSPNQYIEAPPAIRPVAPETSGMGPETVRDIVKDMIGEKIEDEIPPLMADSTISQNDGKVVLEPSPNQYIEAPPAAPTNPRIFEPPTTESSLSMGESDFASPGTNDFYPTSNTPAETMPPRLVRESTPIITDGDIQPKIPEAAKSPTPENVGREYEGLFETTDLPVYPGAKNPKSIQINEAQNPQAQNFENVELGNAIETSSGPVSGNIAAEVRRLLPEAMTSVASSREIRGFVQESVRQIMPDIQADFEKMAAEAGANEANKILTAFTQNM